MYKYFKRTVDSNCILEGKSKALSGESIKPLSAPHNFSYPSLESLGTKTRVRFNRSCLKKDKISYDHGEIVNIYIVREINQNGNTSTDPTLENCFLVHFVD